MPPRWKKWHHEHAGPGRRISHALTGEWLMDETVTLSTEMGPFPQHVQIGEFVEFRRSLVIDGMSQLPGVDEYTESLTNVAGCTVPNAESWFFAGAGDGAGAKRALRFRATKYVEIVDVSSPVVRGTQIHCPDFWGGCHHDQRLKIIISDVFPVARRYVEQGKTFKVVVVDMVDPEDPAYTPFGKDRSSGDHIYTPKTLGLFSQLVAEDGVMVIQAQELSTLRWQGHLWLRRMLSDIFPSVHSYRRFIPFFGYYESFIICSHNAHFDPRIACADPERVLRENFVTSWRDTKTGYIWVIDPLATFSNDIYRGMFAIEPCVEKELGIRDR